MPCVGGITSQSVLTKEEIPEKGRIVLKNGFNVETFKHFAVWPDIFIKTFIFGHNEKSTFYASALKI